ncbi:SubName: Full=Related to middle part of C.elegans myosin heavy chain A {ECO:0000313/EMBL:CCA71885.1} [Serendipita indica DSM 11827]|uniref:Related to middle part of C.elegans myosin heavy chain A n=1 Tax=Serendipita indica (strain DSM 11827) TaxID=1109443 RepID=G4TKN9_SERID|nr:SubName: Full=Related to middle part of C.elegans myosin heavy chain A {ECO:0000313/EMBL:CCA71885.1} [Serendipita indica DSM 11827]CCA71885.1 related to middle part of C.elegans myosin heavy chain A [Serendipita indica DSM 11827]
MATRLVAASRTVKRATHRQIHTSLRVSTSSKLPSGVEPSRCAIDDLRRTRTFSTSASRSDYHFDTHRYVQRLEKEGLTRAQAEGIMNSMAEVIDESIRTMTRNMVTKSEQEKALYTQKVDFGQLKTELQLMERNDLATLKAENDRLMADLEKLKQRLREEITRTQAGVRLDLNLEKGKLNYFQ